MKLDHIRIGGVEAGRDFLQFNGQQMSLTFEDRYSTQDTMRLRMIVYRPSDVDTWHVHWTKIPKRQSGEDHASSARMGRTSRLHTDSILSCRWRQITNALPTGLFQSRVTAPLESTVRRPSSMA